MQGRLLVWSLRHRRWRHAINGITVIVTVVTLTLRGIIAGLAVALLVPLVGGLPSTIASARMPLVHALRDTA